MPTFATFLIHKTLAVQKVLLNAPFQFNEELASAMALLCLHKKQLPTGAPTSPVISNFIFREADTEINQLAQKYGYTYTRYADDLTFSGDQRPGALFKQELEQILRTHGFELNQRKYRVQSKYGRQTVTGLIVNQ
jgi:RNA-directed DNA polymerase